MLKLLEILAENKRTIIKTVVMWNERRNAKENSGMESTQFGNRLEDAEQFKIIP